MFAELIFASFIAAAGGPDAGAQVASPGPAVVEHINDSRSNAGGELRLAADLGCPRHYDRRRGYDPRCHRRHADPYHENGYDRYRRDDRSRYGADDGRYAERDGNYRREPGYRGDDYSRGDRLRDRDGRPYPENYQHRERPSYRDGSYREPRRGYDRRRDEGYRGRGAPPEYGPRRSGDYQSSSYREPAYKKKDTGSMITAMNTTRTAAYAAGSTA